jgi:diguanylate cyclase (GGDEF)-like protein
VGMAQNQKTKTEEGQATQLTKGVEEKRLSLGEVKTVMLESGSIPDQELEKGVRGIFDEVREKIEKNLLTDKLTQIPRRELYEKFADQWIGLSKRSEVDKKKIPVSVIMIDIDKFKDYNDKYGHSTGDAVLLEVAQILQNALPRKTDHVARYGGEEFVVLLPDTDLGHTKLVAERLRATVEQKTKGQGEKFPPVTITCGYAELGKEMKDKNGQYVKIETKEQLKDAADAALYHGKKEGRNQIYEHTRDLKMPTEGEKDKKALDEAKNAFALASKEFEIKKRISEYAQIQKDQEVIQWTENEIGALNKKLSDLNIEIKRLNKKLEGDEEVA